MIAELERHESIHKLKEFICERYGKQLRIIHLLELDAFVNGEVPSAKLVGQDLEVPIEKDGIVFGTAIVPEATDLSEEDRRSVASMICLVLEAPMEAWYQKQFSANSEEDDFNLESLSWKSPEPSAPGFEQSYIVLAGCDDFQIQRTASMAHESSGRWAKVSFSDVKESMILGVHSTGDLGGISVFIPDFSLLDAKERSCVLDYLEWTKQISAEDRLAVPFIIIGMPQAENLSADKQFSTQGLPLLRETLFKVDQLPKEFDKLKMTFEILFEPAHSV